MIEGEIFKGVAPDFVKIAGQNSNEAWCIMDDKYPIMIIATYPETIKDQAHEILIKAEYEIANLLNSNTDEQESF